MIDTRGFAFPKPGHAAGQVKLPPSKYRKHKQRVIEHQVERCRKCGRKIDMNSSHLHHRGGRGIGGGKRDDRKVRALCIDCHREVHGGL